MAVYQPPDGVVVAIGAAYPGPGLLAAGLRLVSRAEEIQARLAPVGLTAERLEDLKDQLDGLERMLTSPRAQKHDTSLQMKEAAELMARARGWLFTLRLVGSVNLAGDTPALHRLASPEPELMEGYPRDFLNEFQRRLLAAQDLAPRLADIGLDRSFLALGRKIASQLKTAVGPRDLKPEDLELELRRLYVRKGTVYLELKRLARMGKLAFLEDPRLANGWDLREIEPLRRIPLPSYGRRPA